MRTVLSKFSGEFVQSVRPLLGPLEAATDSLATSREDGVHREVLPQMREVQHQLRILVDKVADQHAFVLIFGPLKSGKSTMMNALSSAYVSEVTSLPAYPCMVYVSHAPERSFRITRYDGQTETLADTATLQMHLQRSHAELSRAICRTEEAGEEFDPAVHFTEAIRRIDVRMPAGDLEQSGAVLVDTPGLYSRMKFGYDRMTREFRNVAACAIFVVKSDNLFLEQVFEEFGDLLDLFSRIFLVINVDSKKMDLGPRGELVPSVEQKDPLRIVEAFENYAMNASLKRAAEDGRLRIYPIDLLRAARRRLLESYGEQEDVEGTDREASFAGFQSELADYLNSTDYLIAFIDDSLRRAETLLDELTTLCEHDIVREISRKLANLRAEREEAARMREILHGLSDFEWESAFEDFQDRLDHMIEERARSVAHETSKRMDTSIERWFESSSSLQSLLEDDLMPELKLYRSELSGFAHRTLLDESAGLAGGLSLPAETTAMLADSGVSIEELSHGALEEVKSRARFLKIGPPLSADDLPVRKRFWDWFLFRSRAAIRQRLFGPADRPTVRVPVSEKTWRLGPAAMDAMKRAVDRSRGSLLASWNKTLRVGVLTDHRVGVTKALRARFAERIEEVAARIKTLDAEIQEDSERSDRLDRLAAGTETAQELVEQLRRAHGESSAYFLTPPQEDPDEPEEAETDEAVERIVELEVAGGPAPVEEPVELTEDADRPAGS